MVAVPWWAVQASSVGDRGALISAAIAAYALPGALVASCSSRVVSKVSPASMVVFDSIFRSCSLVLFPVVARLDIPWLAVGVLGVSSLFHPWGLAGRRALAVAAFPGREMSGLSVSATMRQIGMISGPACGGVILALGGYSAAFAVDAASFVPLAVYAYFARGQVRRVSDPGKRKVGLTSPVRLLMGDRTIASTVLITISFYFLYGPLEVALPVFVVEDLAGGPQLMGILAAVFAVGSIVGSLATPLVPAPSIVLGLVSIVFAWGSCIVFLAAAHGSASAVLIYGIGGLVFAPYSIWLAVLVRRRLSESMADAGYAVILSMTMLATPIGVVIGGFVVDAFGARITIAGSGVLTIVLAVCAAALLGRELWTRASGPRAIGRDS